MTDVTRIRILYRCPVSAAAHGGHTVASVQQRILVHVTKTKVQPLFENQVL
jgi:hypothetical protein